MTPEIHNLANRYLAIDECVSSLAIKRDNAYARLENEFSIYAAESGMDRELNYDQERKLEELLYG